jgi:hypothetical protein
MPNRLIREGLLDSDRYWSVGIEARQLFVHMLLLADDLGCIGVSPTFLRRRCFNTNPTTEMISKLLNELQDADLLRLYEHDRACYAFIPRFRQRLQRNTLKHPRPPETLLEHDSDAKEQFRKINDITINPTVGQPSPDVGQLMANRRSEEKRREEKQKQVAPAPFELPEWMPAELWNDYEEMRKRIKKPLTPGGKKLAVQKLEQFRRDGHSPKIVLENSIMNSWAGLFPPATKDKHRGFV